jgi:hypothetical protein
MERETHLIVLYGKRVERVKEKITICSVADATHSAVSQVPTNMFRLCHNLVSSHSIVEMLRLTCYRRVIDT